jgi:Tol biopolymer transport system component
MRKLTAFVVLLLMALSVASPVYADPGDEFTIIPISEGFDADLSSDGNHIVFLELIDQDFEVFTVKSDGTDKKQLTNNDIYELAPRWSPDGEKIAFSRNGDIFIMNADGSNDIQLTSGPENDDVPRWSPDGSQILFQREAFGLYTVNTDGGNIHELADLSEMVFYLADWAPDGNSVLFMSSDNSISSFSVNTATGTVSEIRKNAGGPAFSPDMSHFMLSIHDGSYNYSVYIRNEETRKLRVIDGCIGQEWSPDSTKVAYDCITPEGSATTYIEDLDTGERWNLEGFYLIDWSQDGNTILMVENGDRESHISVAHHN